MQFKWRLANCRYSLCSETDQRNEKTLSERRSFVHYKQLNHTNAYVCMHIHMNLCKRL